MRFWHRKCNEEVKKILTQGFPVSTRMLDSELKMYKLCGFCVTVKMGKVRELS